MAHSAPYRVHTVVNLAPSGGMWNFFSRPLLGDFSFGYGCEKVKGVCVELYQLSSSLVNLGVDPASSVSFVKPAKQA